jgi:FkbM family methyltransferase
MRFRGRLKWWLHSYVPGFVGWVDYYGTRVYFPRRALIFEIMCAEGVYEADLTRAIQLLVRPGSWYFDLGANVGLMSVPVLAAVPDAQVLSFEPSPNALPFLVRTRSESPWAARWRVCPKAASYDSGVVDFAIGPSTVGGYDGLRHTHRQALSDRVTIAATTIDSEWRALGSPTVSVIKLDIEGAELDALRGAGDTIAACRPVCVLEWYEANFKYYGNDPTDLLSFAAECGYEVLALPTLSPIASPFTLAIHMSRSSAFLLMPRESNSSGQRTE